MKDEEALLLIIEKDIDVALLAYCSRLNLNSRTYNFERDALNGETRYVDYDEFERLKEWFKEYTQRIQTLTWRI